MLITYNSKEVDESAIRTLNSLNKWKNHIPLYKTLKINKDDFIRFKDMVNLYGEYFDFIFISSYELSSLKEEDLVELILQIIETKSVVYVTNCQTKFLPKLRNTLEYFENTNIKICKDYKGGVNVKEWDTVDSEITKEIFEYDTNPIGTFNNLAINLELKYDSSYELKDFLGNKYELPVEDKIEDKNNLEFIINLDTQCKLHLINKYYNCPFNFNVYEPILNINESTVENMIEYKWKVFDKLKDLDVNGMSRLPNDIVSACNENEFILYKDALKVINGDYLYLKYYKRSGSVNDDICRTRI